MRIQFDTTEGPTLGAGLQPIERHLVIDGPPYRATYTTTRDPSDVEGAPIGEFACDLPEAMVQALRQAAHANDWERGDAPRRGGMGRSYMKLHYQDEELQQSIGFSQMDIEIMEQMEALLDEVDRATDLALEHPHRVLKLSVAPGPILGAAMELVLENVGIQPFCMYDPRRLGSVPGDAWAAVQVAPIEPVAPGFTEPAPQWQSIPLMPPPNAGVLTRGGSVPPLTLQPGQAYRFSTTSWKPEPGHDYYVLAVVHDYEAPPEINGVPCVRGAVFSRQQVLRHAPK